MTLLYLRITLDNTDKKRKELIACGGADELNIPEGIVSIGNYAFYGVGISSIHFPTSLREIGNYAFYDCYCGESFEKESQFNLGSSSIVSIGEYAFSKATSSTLYTSTDEIVLPVSLESIGAHAFEALGEDSIKARRINIRIPAECKITQIPDYAFWDISGTVILECPSQITEIGEYAGCGNCFVSDDSFSPELSIIPTGLFPVTNSLPDTVTEIQSWAFGEVTDFKLPSSLTKIAVDAFDAFGMFGKTSTFIVESGSYAELWCKENGFGYTIEGQEDDLSWLNN